MCVIVRRILIVFGIVAAGVVASGVTSVSASSALPPGVGDFVPTIDLGAALADLSNVPSTSCKVGSSNISELAVGDALNLPASDLIKALAVANALKGKSDSLVALSCSASMTIAGQEKEITGTIVNSSLGLTGSFVLKCTFKQDLRVEADLSMGLTLARGAAVAVRSADKTIPVTCSMAATFTDGTSVAGSVDGVAEVGNLKSDSCVGDGQVSCTPLSISAKVTVTSTTGKLAGYTGSGTYDLKPSFTLPALNSNLSQLQMALGKSSVRAFRTALTANSREGSMRIAFTPGVARTDIVHPVVAGNGSSTFGTGSLMAAVGPRAAKCTYAVTRGKKTVTFSTMKSSATGVMPTQTVTKKQYDAVRKGLAAKAGTTLTFVAACGTVRATQTVTLG